MKKLICSLLTLSLALFVLTASYAEEDTDIEILRAADVNADGMIDILDLVLVASDFGETSTADQPLNSDVNGDDNVNILDLVLVANHLGKTVRPPVAFVSVDPAIDSEITVDDTITLTFDNPPEAVTVSEGTATVTDNTVTIAGPFTPGTLALTITWADGSETLNYTVRQPAEFVSADPESETEITTNDTITLIFDHSPKNFTVSEGISIITGNTVTIIGPFTPGVLELTIIWADGSETLNYTVRQPAEFVSADPESETEITTNDTITLIFDHSPKDVTVSEGVATTDGNTVTITGPFTPGTLELTITWADGSKTFNYTIRQSSDFVSADPESGTEITTNETITLTFDNPPEDVTVSDGVATITDNTVTITGPFTPGTLALTITWADGSKTLDYTIHQPVAFVSIDPTIESQLTVDSTITLTFDNPPEDVTVSEGTATTADNTVTIRGPFTPGTLVLTITWADGSLEFTYTVAEPDTEVPSITGGTINDGDTDVDAEAINSSALIEVEFSEAVSGTIALQTENDDDVGWLGKVEGNKATLELVKGKELDPETTYVIAGKVEDAAGNETDINITFTTASAYDGIPFEVTDETFDTLVLESTLPVVVESYKDG
ncbi:MAG: Ig-like domain-containing protein [Candidatus Poribacteria bacterium]|nr:Ig-like domain-containing protein [Candidatus Poribacteria bacterium]